MVYFVCGLVDDAEKIKCETTACRQSILVDSMLDSCDEDDADIPLDLPSSVVKLVVEFLHHHETNPMCKIDLPISTNNLAEIVSEWDAKFMDKLPVKDLKLVFGAANYMEIKDLLSLCACKFACLVKGKSNEELEAMFGVALSGEEKMRIADENPWIFEINKVVN